MPSLQEALVNAKLSKAESTKFSSHIPKKEKVIEQPKVNETDSKFLPFEKLWTNEKSRGFLTHLLHSFLPFPDNTFIWQWDEKPQWKNGKKCCICQTETLCKMDIFEHLDEITKASLDTLYKRVQSYSTNEEFDIIKEMKQDKEKIFGNRILGVSSDRTSCIICNECYQVFQNWVPTKMLNDQSFCSLINYVRRTSQAMAKSKTTLEKKY